MKLLMRHLICLNFLINNFSASGGDFLRKEDEEMVKKIHIIIKRGNDAEIRKGKDGKLKVLEVKKNIVAM